MAHHHAGMAELADAPDLGSGGFPVEVQILLPAPIYGNMCLGVCRGVVLLNK